MLRNGTLALAAEEPPGMYGNQAMILQYVVATLVWTVLYYLCAWHWRTRMAHVTPSTKDFENDVYWCARCLMGILHGAVVTVIVIYGGLPLYNHPEARFCATRDAAVCQMHPEDGDPCVHWSERAELIAFAGVLFTSYTISDLVASYAHNMMAADFVVHHGAFITAGLIIRGNCLMPFNAAVLMSMEASTPFLNYMLLFRHRGDEYATGVMVSGALFVLLFVIFRILINTWGAYLLVVHRSSLPAHVAPWQVSFLMSAVVAGAALQFFWLPGIAKIFYKNLVGLLRPKIANGDSNGNGYVALKQ